MKFTATATITRRASILDPQGKAVEQGARNLGIGGISEVRFDKQIRFTIEAATPDEAREQADTLCRKLLANPVMEDYAVDVYPNA